MIHVCSLARLHSTVEEVGARHIVTLIANETRVVRPDCVVEDNHLFLQMHDISAHLDGYTLTDLVPQPSRFRALLGVA